MDYNDTYNVGPTYMKKYIQDLSDVYVLQAYFNYCNALSVGYGLVLISINVKAYRRPISQSTQIKVNHKACTLLVDYENDDMKQNFYSKNQNLSQTKKWLKFPLRKKACSVHKVQFNLYQIETIFQ